MDEARFWALIEAAKQASEGDLDLPVKLLLVSLVQPSPAEIAGFADVLDTLRARSYRRDLWGAAYVINGGCSDDGFDYFRGWLIAQGEQVFETALRDPDSLAEAVSAEVGPQGPPEESRWVGREAILYVADEAYEAATGADHCGRQPGGRSWWESGGNRPTSHAGIRGSRRGSASADDLATRPRTHEAASARLGRCAASLLHRLERPVSRRAVRR